MGKEVDSFSLITVLLQNEQFVISLPVSPLTDGMEKFKTLSSTKVTVMKQPKVTFEVVSIAIGLIQIIIGIIQLLAQIGIF